MGTTSNGSSRSVAYNREPIVRMANTYLEPGDHSFEDSIADISHGIYIKNFMEWNIDDRRFNQRYVGLEAYRIKAGRLEGMVKNPLIEMTTPALGLRWTRWGMTSALPPPIAGRATRPKPSPYGWAALT